MQSPRLAFVVLGLDHTTAGIEFRERLAFADAEIPAALHRLTDGANPLLDQAAILSTCNRVELYGICRGRPAEGELLSFLAGYHGLEASRIASMTYTYGGDEVAHHLAATAAGIHSLVLGEAQILGQIRKALEHALTAGTAGAELRRLFESAIAAGRRVRSGTAIGRGSASVPHAGVELARRRLGTLNESTALLIGTGDMSQLAAKQLVKRGATRLFILGRTPSQASRFAQSYGGHPITRDRVDEALAQSDVVISATGAPAPVLFADQVRRALARRRTGAGPLLLIDLSVPRDVDPEATELPGVELHTIDDLRETVARALTQRRAELPEAYKLLGNEVGRFTTWLSRREAGTFAPGNSTGGTQVGRPGTTRAQSDAIECILRRSNGASSLGSLTSTSNGAHRVCRA